MIEIHIKNHFLQLGIKQKVQYIFIFAIAICVLFCFTFFYFILRTRMTSVASEKNDNNLRLIEQNFEAVVENVNNISKLIMVNDAVTTYLKYDGDNPVYSNSAVSEIYNILISFSGSFSVFAFRNDTDYIRTGIGVNSADKEIIFGSDWYGQVLEREGGYVLLPNTSKAFRLNTNVDIISFARIINDINTQKQIGVLVINIRVSELEKTYGALANEDNHFAYLDKDGGVICCDKDFDTENLPSEDSVVTVYDGLISEKVVTSRLQTDSGIQIVCRSTVRFMEGMTAEIFISLLSVLIITILIMMLISAYINKYIIFPISKLAASMQQVETGFLRRVSLPASSDEIGKLRDSYNEMLIRINNLINEVIKQEQDRQKAEMDALQVQIKPHFLYNTLDTIGYMALERPADEVYDAIETLGNFYRKFLSKGSKTIRLADEIGIIKDYIKLQRLRYDNLFTDEYDIQSGLDDIMFPKLILQPLVENSIYHGIRPKGENGIIRVTVYAKDNMLHINVYDDGVGMSAEQRARLLGNEEKTDSFGFKGTIDRLRYYYNIDNVVDIESVEGKFCEVKITVPLEQDKPNI